MLRDIFQKTVSAHDLCQKTHRILVTVSGGKDSMALLHLFLAEGYAVEVAHVNFKLRRADSDADEHLVAAFCREHSVPFHTRSFDTKAFAAQQGWSTQMAARALRYSWFEELAAERQMHRIATAHHLHDNLETLLLNFTKGTGPRGLTGIPVKTGVIIRPLLYARPEQIMAYLEQNGIPWREDLSNRDDHYQRNRLRNRVIPLLKEINPGLEHTFSVNLERFRDLETVFNQALNRFEATLIKTGKEIRIPLTALAAAPGITLVLEEFLKPYGFNRQDTLLVLDISETGKKVLSPTHTLTRERDHWRLSPKREETATEILIPETGIFAVGERRLSVTLVAAATVNPDYSNPYTAWLDADKISWPLRMRPWKDGDRFIPFGMKGSKLISDYLKDRKTSASEKKDQWVVEDSKGILWLAGHRIADPYRITASTQKVLHLELGE